MNLLKISWSNIKHKPLNTLLSIVLLAFGVGIISMMLLLKSQISEKFDRNIKDIDFVLAAKGSPLQSMLANIYHVDVPTGNIKVSEAKRIIKNPMVAEAIPLAYGDNYEKFRIVGTNEKYPNHYGCTVEQGKLFSAPFEVTIGVAVAQETGLKLGSTFTSMHGYDNAADDADAHHHQVFTVVGIFSRSNTVIDNLILTPVEPTWMVHEHPEDLAAADSASADTLHQEPEREMTAYLIKKRNKGAFGMLSKQTEDTTMQLANVAVENSRLMNNFGIGLSTITAIAVVIMVISFISIFISLFNSMRERRYELALMRTMGGTRATLFTLIIQEGLLLVLLGYAVGLLLSRLGLLVLSNFMKESFHYGLDNLAISTQELMLLGLTLLVGLLASVIPAAQALKIDISKTLTNA
ncbi:MAG: ABC transporter permease [Flavobacteriales bacterium]